MTNQPTPTGAHMPPTEAPARTTTFPLTVKQATALWVVAQNQPVSVADVAGHMLISDAAARSALDRMELRGLLARTYTGHSRRARHAYVITPKGQRCLDRADTIVDDIQ